MTVTLSSTNAGTFTKYNINGAFDGTDNYSNFGLFDGSSSIYAYFVGSFKTYSAISRTYNTAFVMRHSVSQGSSTSGTCETFPNLSYGSTTENLSLPTYTTYTQAYSTYYSGAALGVGSHLKYETSGYSLSGLTSSSALLRLGCSSSGALTLTPATLSNKAYDIILKNSTTQVTVPAFSISTSSCTVNWAYSMTSSPSLTGLTFSSSTKIVSWSSASAQVPGIYQISI